MSTLRVIKLGGSLLKLPSLNERFQAWCHENPHPLTFIIVGGGGIVDALRGIDQANSLDEEFTHWLSIDLMQHTARIAHRLLDNVDLIDTPDQLRHLISGAGQPTNGQATNSVRAIVQVGPCFFRNEPQLTLPASWDVTSDTIAAAFAIAHTADELVIMKSIAPPARHLQMETLAASGYVDPCFADFANQIKQVRFVNLRAIKTSNLEKSGKDGANSDADPSATAEG